MTVLGHSKIKQFCQQMRLDFMLNWSFALSFSRRLLAAKMLESFSLWAEIGFSKSQAKHTASFRL